MDYVHTASQARPHPVTSGGKVAQPAVDIKTCLLGNGLVFKKIEINTAKTPRDRNDGEWQGKKPAVGR